MCKYIDLTNKVFGRLTAIERITKDNSRGGHRKTMWRCKCSCGNEKIVSLSSLRVGDTRSCGCITKEINKSKIKSSSNVWKGYKDISGQVFCWLRNGATRRLLPFNITIEDVWNQFISQKEKCYLTGLPISFLENTASVDRIDSSKGYERDNIAICLKIVNKMKMDIPLDEFVKICHNISAYNKIKL
jgi:hypothetical protein